MKRLGVLAFVAWFSVSACAPIPGNVVDEFLECSDLSSKTIKNSLSDALVAILMCSVTAGPSIPACAVAGIIGLANSLPDGKNKVACALAALRDARSATGGSADDRVLRARAEEGLKVLQDRYGVKVRATSDGGV